MEARDHNHQQGASAATAMLTFYSLTKNNEKEKPHMLEREAWRFINNKRADRHRVSEVTSTVSPIKRKENHCGRTISERSRPMGGSQSEGLSNSERQRLHNKRKDR